MTGSSSQHGCGGMLRVFVLAGGLATSSGCADEGGAAASSEDSTEDAGTGDTETGTDSDTEGGDPFACPQNVTCPDVPVGTSALLFTAPGATGDVRTLTAGRAGLAAFNDDTVSFTPVMWGSPDQADGSVSIRVTGHYDELSPGNDLLDMTFEYEPGPGGRFEAEPLVSEGSGGFAFLRVVTQAYDGNGSPFGLLDSDVRVDLFEPSWRGASGPQIAIPVRIWRLRTSDDQYGATVSEAELLEYFDAGHVDPWLPNTVNEIFAPVGIRFEAEVETLQVPAQWDHLVRRVPCDDDQGTCTFSQRWEFAQTFGDPLVLNVFVVYIIAFDDVPPSDTDDLQTESVFGLTYLPTWEQDTSTALPGVWLSSKIWIDPPKDARTWPSRVIAHELGHALGNSHHSNEFNRLLMTTTSQTAPDDFVGGSAIVDLPTADKYWADSRAHATTFAASHPAG